ncbi:C-reactive protein-like [Phyllobates terribilis]|uniref:C-reactive protein-like n=1 Tax=Phyllobates terribilis TaxID=111132 RepID=UPI003CCB5AD4
METERHAIRKDSTWHRRKRSCWRNIVVPRGKKPELRRSTTTKANRPDGIHPLPSRVHRSLREVLSFSYCNDGKDELNVWKEMDGRLSLYLRTSIEAVIISVPDLRTFGTHIWVTWWSSSGVTSFWVDDKRSTSQVYRKAHNVSSGGTVILGQERIPVGGSFDAKQSFVGEISV